MISHRKGKKDAQTEKGKTVILSEEEQATPTDSQNVKIIHKAAMWIRRLVKSFLMLFSDYVCSKGLPHKDKRYELKSCVGEGGMNSIICAYDKELERYSALKFLKTPWCSNQYAVSSFTGEARIMAQLEHPNVMPVHDIGYCRGEKKPFFAMKLFTGAALQDILHQLNVGNEGYIKKYNRYELLRIFRKVCDAVAFAHSQRIVHCDIKPHNIMVGEYGEVLLSDWGLAVRTGPRNSVFNTDEAQPWGTPAYMAPEMAVNSPAKIDERTDVFLLGATLYSVITYQPPFQGDTREETIQRAIEGTFELPERKRPDLQIPRELTRVTTRAMAVDPEERYQSVEELNNDIDDFLSGRVQAQVRVFGKGEYLMRAGTPGMEAYVITSGRVQVVKSGQESGKPVVLADLGPGEIIGEMALVTNTTRSADVIAVEDTEVEVVTLEQMKGELQKLSPWMENAVTKLANRLAAADVRLENENEEA